MWRATALATILTATAVSHAATPATASGPTAPAGPQVSTPYWNQPTGPLGDMPAVDIRNIPVARANAVRTRWQFNQGVVDLSNAVRLVRMTMDRQPDYVKAQADEKAAYNAMETARAAVITELKNNPSYAAAENLRESVSKQIAEEQFAVKPDQTALAAMAKLKLQYVKDSRKLEVAALEGDQNYQDAKQKYVDAAKRVADYRDAQAVAIASDDTLQGIRKSVADARIEKLAAQAFYSSSITAAANAVEYSLRYRGVDRYHGYGNGYGAYGNSNYGNYGFGNYGFGPGYRY